MLHDGVIPIFWAMRLLGATTKESQVVVLHSNAAGGPNALHAYFQLLSSRPLLYADELPCSACPPNRWCRIGRALAAVSHRVLGIYDTAHTSAAEAQVRGDAFPMVGLPCSDSFVTPLAGAGRGVPRLFGLRLRSVFRSTLLPSSQRL